MIEESKYCTDIMKNHLKELVMTKKSIMKILKILVNVGFVIMFKMKVMLK